MMEVVSLQNLFKHLHAQGAPPCTVEVLILELFELFGSLGIVSWAKALESIILV